MKTISLFILFLIITTLLLLPVEPAHAVSTYYCDTTGNDSTGDGSQGNPWLTIGYSVDQLSAGDILNVNGGTYTPASQITPANNGSIGNYITIQPTPGTTVGIDGSSISSMAYYSGIFHITTDYIIVDGFNFTTATHAGISANDADNVIIKNNAVTDTNHAGIVALRCTNITIDNNDVYGTNKLIAQEAISLITCSYFEVKNNYVHDLPETPSGWWCGYETPQSGIDMKVGCHNGTVHHNHVSTGIHAIYIDGYGLSQYAIDVYNNHVEDFYWGGISLNIEVDGSGDSLYDIEIYNNVIHDPKAGCYGYGIFWDDGDNNIMTYSDIKVYNNTLYNFTSQGDFPCPIAIYGDASSWPDLVFQNNIFWGENSVQGSIKFVDGSDEYNASNHTFTNNIYGVDGSHEGSNHYGSGNLTGTPSFVNAASNCAVTGFALTSTSNAVNAGTSTTAASSDYEDNSRPRPIGGAFDIGAFEYHAPADPPPVAVTSGSLPSTAFGRPISGLTIDGRPGSSISKIY